MARDPNSLRRQILMKTATNTVANNDNSKLSPAQIASGAHNDATPDPYSILEKLFTEGFKDDHRGWFGAINHNVYKPNVAIVRTDLRNGAVEVCFASENSPAFSINPFYMGEDGMLHLSRWSVGATVHMRGSLEESVAFANKEALCNRFYMHEILSIVRKEDFMKAFEDNDK